MGILTGFVLEVSFILIIFFFSIYCICVRTSLCAMSHMWRSGKLAGASSLLPLIVPQGSNAGGKHPYPQSHLIGPTRLIGRVSHTQ